MTISHDALGHGYPLWIPDMGLTPLLLTSVGDHWRPVHLGTYPHKVLTSSGGHRSMYDCKRPVSPLSFPFEVGVKVPFSERHLQNRTIAITHSGFFSQTGLNWQYWNHFCDYVKPNKIRNKILSPGSIKLRFCTIPV